uniref:ATP-dependent DNA helicase n=1 Tax=Cannabis sativa TaxID=3483 RepID=A0A803PB99_CANSA
MLDQNNNLVKSFRMVRDRYKEQPESTFRLRLLQSRTTDGRQYNMPTVSEVAGLIVGDFTEANYERDVIVEHRTNGLQIITDLHPSFMSMTYPLIHPYGEDGYRLHIPFRAVTETTSKRKQLTMLQYYSFRFQQRLNEGHTLLLAGRLLQQYIVDSYMAIEEERFRYVRKYQNKLRTHLYSGLMDAIHRGDSDCTKVGKTIILPSSHTGGPRYRAQNYQDAMAICKWAGYPDLFLTFTCNPKWPEIKDMLNLIGQKDDENRVDIICRVFQIKLFQLMQDLKQEQPFGKIIACVYTIEFQKRGLPHAHILLFLDPTMKNPSAAHIDKIISAEIPDINVDPDGYNAVKKFMIHGPCGKLNANSPCMMKDKCTKHFPKKFNDQTTIDIDGFPIYKRRNTGERFYMRMLLNFVKGCTSYESIRTVNGVTYSTFKGACYALGLLDDDKKWIDCFTEAAIWATGNELRHLFVTILIHCQVSDATKLWQSNYTTLLEDIVTLQRKRFRIKDLQLNDQQVEAYTLFEIESIMHKMGKSLKDIDGMPLPNSSLMRESGNRLVNEELAYDREKFKILHDKSFAVLNPSQKSAYEAILQSVENEEGHLFFISGHGGTGKTFLWNTLIAKLRSESKIVLPVATSGIAALLLPNGRTAHSRFHIPLEVSAESTCEIRHGTLLSELLMKTSLIIWDEAPMENKYCFEALDKTLRDILRTRYENSTTKRFGGLTIICGGDFRQIFPVVPKGTRSDIVDASLNSSYLWLFFKIYELNQNMRLYNGSVDEYEVAKIASFDKWLLHIGDGSLYDDIDRELIKIPSDIYKKPSNDPMNSMVEAIYPSLLHNYSDPTYLKERAILTPKK